MQEDNLTYSEAIEKSQAVQSFFSQVYGWMFFGLFTTGIFAYYTANSNFLLNMIFGNSMVFYGLLFAELLLVVGISGMINSIGATTASFMFFVYSALNGLTLASIFLLYTNDSIAMVFFITGGTFGAMSLYGYMTKTDLTKMGSMMLMALIGLVIASLINLFWQNPALMWITTYAGVLIFVGLTAYDTQKLKNIAHQIREEEAVRKLAVMGALTLYLDFVNLFLYFLRIFGKRK